MDIKYYNCLLKFGQTKLLSHPCLPLRIEEPAVRSLEAALSQEHVLSAIQTLILPILFFALFEAERVHSVGAAKELGLAWIFLHIFPSRVRPSAWHQL